jgi:hypothetical protein
MRSKFTFYAGSWENTAIGVEYFTGDQKLVLFSKKKQIYIKRNGEPKYSMEKRYII